MGLEAEEWNQAVERLRGVSVAERWQSEDVAKLYAIALKVAPSQLRSFDLPGGLPEDLAADILTTKLNQQVDCVGVPFSFFVVSLQNKAKSWKRHQRVRANYQERQSAPEPEPIAEHDGSEVERRLAKAWGVLTDRERDIFERIGRDEPREEIASRLGTSRTNVDQLISRARKKLERKGLP